jgi:hypothetical protein
MSHVNAGTGSPAKNAWAIGGTVFAATMMIMIGVFQILMGISAIANDSFLVVRGDYVYNVDTTAWGWIHLVLGALVLLTGISLFTGATWAKVAGIVLVVLAAVDNFLFIPYYPIWSLLLIAMDVFVVWALAHSLRTTPTTGDLLADSEAGYGAAQGGQRWANNPSAGYRPGDPEAAGRASDMAAPGSARHAQGAPDQTMSGTQMTGAPMGGSAGGAMPGAPGATGQPRPPAPPTDAT